MPSRPEVARARKARQYAERLASGACVRCARGATLGRAVCATCLAAQQRRHVAARAAGRCTVCGAPSGAWARCEACRAFALQKRRANGRPSRAKAATR